MEISEARENYRYRVCLGRLGNLTLRLSRMCFVFEVYGENVSTFVTDTTLTIIQ